MNNDYSIMFAAIDRILEAETSIIFHYLMNDDELYMNYQRGSHPEQNAWLIPISSMPKSIHRSDKLELDLNFADWAVNPCLIGETLANFVSKLKPVQHAARFYMTAHDQDSVRLEVEKSYSKRSNLLLGELTCHVELTDHDHWTSQCSGHDFQSFFSADELFLISEAAGIQLPPA